MGALHATHPLRTIAGKQEVEEYLLEWPAATAATAATDERACGELLQRNRCMRRRALAVLRPPGRKAKLLRRKEEPEKSSGAIKQQGAFHRVPLPAPAAPG